MSKGLFVFLEGPDDDRFVKKVLVKELEKVYTWVKTYQYSKKKQQAICKFLNSILRMGADYIFLADMDLNPCITIKLEKIIDKFKCLEDGKENIFIVRTEIESWYLAGFDITKVNCIQVRNYLNTDQLTKEQFNQTIPRSFDSRVDYMQEILKNYSIDLAVERNSSFRRFATMYGIR